MPGFESTNNTVQGVPFKFGLDYEMSLNVRKCTFGQVLPAKIQIRLRIQSYSAQGQPRV